jgi:hypothetical protein
MKICKTDDGKLIYYCEGCECLHYVNDRWTFNGDYEKPTFTPSILVRGTKFTEKGEEDYEAWHDAGSPKREEPFDHFQTICHFFVTEGKIQYLSDCTHKLAGQTVDLLDKDDWYKD